MREEDVAVYGSYQIIVHTNLLRRIFKVSIDGSIALPARGEKCILVEKLQQGSPVSGNCELLTHPTTPRPPHTSPLTSSWRKEGLCGPKKTGLNLHCPRAQS